MRKLLIVGAGGHGRVVADTALATKQYDSIAFLDDRYREVTSVMGWPVVGSVSQAADFLVDYPFAMVAIGANMVRVRIIQSLMELGFQIPVIIHPGAYVGTEVQIGAGSVILALSVVNTGARIGLGAIINTGAAVDHDNRIAEGVHISPGTHLAGEVTVGAYVWIGAGAVVVPQLSIGAHSVIGAGSVIIRNVPEGVTVVGNPGRVLRKGKKNEHEKP